MSTSSSKTTVVSHGAVTTAGTGSGGTTGAGGTTEEQEARLRQRLQAAIGDSFALLELLGRGGMGIVFRARELALDREVALKVLTLDPILNPEAFHRFEREARLAARLDHPNIVPIFAVGSRDSLAYYTMRLVRGGSVEDLLAKGEPLPFERAVRILRDVAAALDYAHRSDVVHRDIKPANILLGESGHAMVADFGIAKGLGAGDGATANVTGTGVIGSPAYMSPEQWRGDMVDGRADQYALGVVAYEMLVGRRPFESPRVQDLLRMHMSTEVPDASLQRPGLDAAAGTAIRRAMSKYSSERFGTATAFVEALAGNRPAVPRPVARAAAHQAPRAQPKRRRVVLPLLLLCAAVVGAGLAIPATRPRTLAALEQVEARALEATAFVSVSLGLPAPNAAPDERTPPAGSAPLLAMATDSAHRDSIARDSLVVDTAALSGGADTVVAGEAAPLVRVPLVRTPLVSTLGPDSADRAGFRRVERPEYGVVHVVTRGGSARVRVDGQAYGFSPQLLPVAPGRHHVTVEGAGDAFLPTQVMLDVAAGDTALAEFATPSARAAAQQPAPARVTVPPVPVAGAGAPANVPAPVSSPPPQPVKPDSAPPPAARDSAIPPRR